MMNDNHDSAALCEHHFLAALSTASDAALAAEEVCQRIVQRLGAEAVGLAVVFVSGEHVRRLTEIAETICELLKTENLVGCSGEAVVSGELEIEHGAAVSLWVAGRSQLEASIAHVRFERSLEGGAFVGWPREWSDANAKNMLLFAEPFSFPADVFMERLDEDHPATVVVGGMASGGHAPGENLLVHGRCIQAEGALAVRLSGKSQLLPLVSQGCRPVGQPLVITRAERNTLLELGGRPAFEQLENVFLKLPNREQALMQAGPHVGRVVDEYRDHFEPGDFLVRNIVGVDRETGAITIADYFRVGQTLQFHIRDAETAHAEFELLLGKMAQEQARVQAVLMFTCNGRGTGLFETPHHDASAVQQAFGRVAQAGFFAQGEIGPVGGKNFLHGFTASLAVFAAAE